MLRISVQQRNNNDNNNTHLALLLLEYPLHLFPLPFLLLDFFAFLVACPMGCE